MMSEIIIRKPVICVATAGHVDSGKSTIIGQIFTARGRISQHELNKLKAEAEKFGKSSFEYAYALDSNEAERKKGVTISAKTKEFETDKYSVTVIDCPGHLDYLKNMISGSSQADHGILMVNAQKGIEPQTEVHASILTFMRVNTIIVVINKMDLPNINYSEASFNETKKQLEILLKAKGYLTVEAREKSIDDFRNGPTSPDETAVANYAKRLSVGTVVVLPAAGYLGENVFQKTTKMPWWNGPYLLEAIDALPMPKGLEQEPFRMQISQLINIPKIPPVWCGKVLSGSVSVGDKVLLKPGVNVEPKLCEVKSIERHHSKLTKAIAGDNVGMIVKDLKTTDAEKGFVFCDPANPIPSVVELTGMVLNMHPQVGIKVNSEYTMSYGTANVPVRVIKFKWIRKGGEMLPEDEIDRILKEGDQDEMICVKHNEVAQVVLKPLKTICMQPAIKSRVLGRVILRTDTVIGVCAVEEVKAHESDVNIPSMVARSRL